MAVEWLRSCYSANWRFFLDSPDTLVRGRYYFSPPKTPFVSSATVFCSRTWDGNGTITGSEPSGTVPVVLGEVRGQPQRWDSGALPVTVPGNANVGSLDCLLDGEGIGSAIDAGELDGGFPTACFIPAPAPNEDFEFGFRVWSCPTQAFWIDQIVFLYNAWFTDLIAQCQQRFAGATITVTKQSALFPAYALIVQQNYACFVTSGTTTLSQALVQALQGFAGPQDYGQFSTAKLWYDFATQIIQVFGAAGVLDGRPLLLAGHSYGGAACLIAAARLSIAYPKVELRYITYGSPKPGDQRLRALLDGRYDGLSLVNDGDLITALPPDNNAMFAMESLATFGIVLGWLKWLFPPETTLMQGTQLLKNTYQRYDSRSLASYISGVISSGSLATLVPHNATEYQKRIALRCAAFIPTNVGLVFAIQRTSKLTTVIITPCCPSGSPLAFSFVISGCPPPNDFLNGLHGQLGAIPPTPIWSGFVFTAHGTASLQLSCQPPPGWLLAWGSPFFGSYAAAESCGALVFSGSVLTPLGSTSCTITVTPIPP